jgi:hypothetical protein
MNQLFNRTSSQGSISLNGHLGTTWVVMIGMVALLVLIGTPVVSAEQTPTESVQSRIDGVIHILNNDALKQPSALWNDVRRSSTSSGNASAMKTWPE